MKSYVSATWHMGRKRTHARVIPLLWRNIDAKVRHVYREYLRIIVERYFVTSILHTDEPAEIMSPRARPLRLFTTLRPIPCLLRECDKCEKCWHILAHKISSPRSLEICSRYAWLEYEKGERPRYFPIFWFPIYLKLLSAFNDIFYFDTTFMLHLSAFESPFRVKRYHNFATRFSRPISKIGKRGNGKDCRSFSARFHSWNLKKKHCTETMLLPRSKRK